MATYYNDVELSIMSESGDAHIIYPITHENNVVITKPTVYKGNSNINTLKNLIENLGSAAFASVSTDTGVVTKDNYQTNSKALVNREQLYNQFLSIKSDIAAGAFTGPKGDKGDPGLLGPQGPTGATGVRGHVPIIYSSDASQKNGDTWYFEKRSFNDNLTTGDAFIWHKSKNEVFMCKVVAVNTEHYGINSNQIVSLIGPQGPAGKNGTDGGEGPRGPVGPTGTRGSKIILASGSGFDGGNDYVNAFNRSRCDEEPKTGDFIIFENNGAQYIAPAWDSSDPNFYYTKKNAERKITGATGTFNPSTAVSAINISDNNHTKTTKISAPNDTNYCGLDIITASVGVGTENRGLGIRFATCSSAILPLARYLPVSGQNLPSDYANDAVTLGGHLHYYNSGHSAFCQVINLGSESNAFGTIYSGATASTSDMKQKKDRTLISDDVYEEIFDDIEFIKYKWKYNQNSALDSRPSSRFHYGLIAQEVEEVFHKHGIDNMDNGIIKAKFFLNNTSGKFISGGHQPPFEKDGITYSYSENVWNFKHGLEYRIYNEIIEKEMHLITDAMPERQTIGYLSFEDNSKLAEGVHAPNIKINGAYLVDADDNYTKLEFVEGESVALYSILDPEFTTPRTHDKFNEDGSVEILYDDCDSWQNARHMLKIKTPFNIFEYKKIVLDMDYIGEYKVYLMPDVHYNHSNHYFSETYGNTECFDYSLDYNEFTMMALSVLQKTKKRQEEEINDLKEVNETLLTKLDELESRLAVLEK